MTEPNPPPTDPEKGAADALVQLAVGPAADPKEIVKEAAERSSIVLYNWKTLADILDRHEDGLRRRWTKKTITWRKTVLYKAWPSMPEFHRPDFEILSMDKSQIGSLEWSPRWSFLLPYINMDDLCREKPLLCLLNTRARSPPESLADQELETCHLGLRTNSIVPLKLEGYTM